MFKVEVLENESILSSEMFFKYDESLDYSFDLLDILEISTNNKKIKISENEDEDDKSWKLLKTFQIKK